MQASKIDSMQFEFPLDGVYRSLFQEDFSVIERNLKTALRFGYNTDDLFEIILCDFMKRIKDYSNMLMKFIALKNAMRALEYLGALHKNIEGGINESAG